MMSATRKITTHDDHAVHNRRFGDSRAAGQGGKKKISATERWVMISKNVYSRAQQRGFVGGDPFEDLSDAAREVDEEYATDVQGLLALTDPVELVEQFRAIHERISKEPIDQSRVKNSRKSSVSMEAVSKSKKERYSKYSNQAVYSTPIGRE